MRHAFTGWDGALIALLVGVNGFLLFRPAPPIDRVEVVSDGPPLMLDLRDYRRLAVRGPLGVTVVEVGPSGARIAASPCPNQLCVRAGAVGGRTPLVACVPNRVALRLAPSVKRPDGGKGVDAVAR